MFNDALVLELGRFQVRAGPGGSTSGLVPEREAGQSRWQAASSRGFDQRGGFEVNIGAEPAPGVQAPSLRTIISSQTSISWDATLEPFAKEFPPGCDWIDWGYTTDLKGEHRRLAQRWSMRDRSNQALDKVVPEQLVRSRVIDSVNRDLVTAVSQGWSVSIDALHAAVVGGRIAEGGWAAHGFALPILVPEVGNMPWDAIVAIRQHRSMARFRQVLREVEADLMDEVLGGGDVERAVHRVIERRLLEEAATPSIGSQVRYSLVGLVVGGTANAGVAVSGVTAPLEVAAGTALGGVIDLTRMLSTRRGRRRLNGWQDVLTDLGE